ncbi:TIGR01777 family oxidoreductase [Actinophytocola sp.]|uniref:TIGR01777 family oxidoreductase n=1 Tax=Actinophytocola sp. TaxID=1872138 RepID=UPI002D6BA0F6|nr:TIGR01777 family oxidoreductase [Actinophytocola sp.]HYQ69157.1 TIGR01777 family oxidoreductase [Actinophytocola sp.]
MKVAISGTSGLLGDALVRRLGEEGHHVLRLVRRRPESHDEILWYPEVDTERLREVDAVIHLVGETLVGRWTSHQREAIRESRVVGTRLLASALANMSGGGPRVFLCASATSFYGSRPGVDLTEESQPGQGFLASVYQDMEAATVPVEAAGTRVVRLRFGILHAAEGGALPVLLPKFRAGLGLQAGRGNQWVSWVTLSDATRAVSHVLRSTLSGPVNVVAPNPVTNREYADTLASVLRRPRWLTLSPPLLRRVFGAGLADEVLLASTRVVPTRLLSSGFHFEFPELRAALQNLLLPVT